MKITDTDILEDLTEIKNNGKTKSDPKAAMYYMFRNSGNEKGGLEIAQMNIV